jgi:gliding motility associated protien GldN
MKKVFLLVALLETLIVFSQTKTPIAHPVIREADVMWAKDIWRIIDLNERENFPFYFPIDKRPNQLNLFNILLTGIDSNKITAYKSDDMVWNDTLTKKQLFDRVVVSDSITVYSVDEFGNENLAKQLMSDTLGGEYIAQYWIKEKWFFDKQRSVMDVRIVAICPVKYDVSKEMLIPLFWINYSDARNWLSQFQTINSKNISEQRTFDELFIKRKFVSVIKKESNIYDREIEEYVNNVKEFLQESERIKEFIRNFEADRWEN